MSQLSGSGRSADVSELTYKKSAAFGKAVEHLIAASCILSTSAKLNVSTSFVDDDGVDLVFHLRGGTSTLAVQVKHNSTSTQKVQRQRLICDVRTATFRPRSGLWMLFVVVDFPTAQLGDVFFVPSAEFARRASGRGGPKRKISASLKPHSNDQWQGFRSPFAALPGRVIEELARVGNGSDGDLLPVTVTPA
jgi:hypothetical protein